MIAIYDKSNKVIINAPVTSDAIRNRELMSDNYVSLQFNWDSYIDFEKGVYIIYKGERFEVMANVYPEYLSTSGGWRYNIIFEAVDGHLKKYNIFYRKQGVTEVVFNMTTDLLSFGNLIADNINYELGGSNWKVKAIPEEYAIITKAISFKGEKLFDAMTMIAEQFECEWWTEQNGGLVYICFGKLTFGTEEELIQGDVVSLMPVRKGDDSNYGTRFYVFGSNRNLTSSYGQAQQGGVTNHISEIRLHLPNGQQYIDAWDNLAPQDIVEQLAIFDDIYPKNTEVVTSVETVQRPIENSNETFTAYVMVVNETPFTPANVIKGETMGCVFESGSLQGREFEIQINYDPEKWKPEDGFDKKFEIVAVTEGEGDSLIVIPNDFLKPKVGDKFVLTGVELPIERIEEAENELLKAGKSWAVRNSSDTNLYDCPTNPVYCQLNDKNYDLGQKVKLIDVNRFGINGRSSRIQGYEKKLANEYEATYTVGDNTAYSRLSAIESEIKAGQYAERIGVVSGAGIYLIRSKYDNTQPSEFNAYSALASNNRFLSRKQDDQALGRIGFIKGFDAKNGTVEESLTSKRYVSGAFGEGGAFRRDPVSGDWIVECDRIYGRKTFTVKEFITDKTRSIKGSLVVSSGGGKVASVVEGETSYTLTLEDETNPFMAGDYVRCQVFTGSTMKFYWVSVLEVAANTITVPKTEFDEGVTPEEGDEIVQLGNDRDTSRQGAIYITASDSGAPMIDVLDGISSRNLSGCMKVRLGNLSGITDTTLNPHGYGLYALNCFLSGSFRLTNGMTLDEYVDQAGVQIEKNVTTNITASGGAIELGVKTEVGKVQIGGTNYIKKNDFYEIDTFYQANLFGLLPNTQYVVSGNAQFEAVRYNYSSAFVYSNPFTTPDSFHTLSIYVKQTVPLADLKIKLEKGNKATDWSPAPEDMASKTELEAKISVTEGKISAAVSEIRSGLENLFVDGSFEADYNMLDRINVNADFSTTLYNEAFPKFGNKLLYAVWNQTDSHFYIQQQIPVTPGKTYQIVFWHFDGGFISDSSSYILASNGEHHFIPMTWQYGWHKQVHTWTVPDGVEWIKLRFGAITYGNAWSVFDGIQVFEGTEIPAGDNFTPSPKDVPNALKRTGIDIELGKITLDSGTGGAVVVKNGDQTAAMFEGGKIKAQFIDVDNLTAKRVDAVGFDGSRITINPDEPRLSLRDGPTNKVLASIFPGHVNGRPVGYIHVAGVDFDGTEISNSIGFGTFSISKSSQYTVELSKDTLSFTRFNGGYGYSDGYFGRNQIYLPPGSKVDMPGILGGGMVTAGLRPNLKKWGKIYAVERVREGLYDIYHTLGDVDYFVPSITVVVKDNGGWVGIGHLMYKYSNLFGILITDTNGGSADADFEFMVMGDS